MGAPLLLQFASGAVISSIRASTSGVSWAMTSTAPRFSCSCEIFDAPVITVLTRGLRAAQAIAISGSRQPSSAAPPSRRHALAILAGQQAAGQWTPGGQAQTDVLIEPRILLFDPLAVEQVVLRLLHDGFV